MLDLGRQNSLKMGAQYSIATSTKEQCSAVCIHGVMQIFAKTLISDIITLNAGTSISTNNVKFKVQNREGVPLDQLFPTRKQLEDRRKLCHYNIP